MGIELGPQRPRGRSRGAGGWMSQRELELCREEEETAIFSFLVLSFGVDRLIRDETFHS